MKKSFKVTAIATLSSSLECYDFVIYAALTPHLHYNFFSNVSPSIQAFCTLMVFAIGYVSRPVGGIIFGTIGDKYGRKKTFIYSISLMALATVTIAILPTAPQIGSVSTLLLVVCRYVQGLSQGGEVPGAITFVAEHVKTRTASRNCAFIFLGLGFGSLLSAFVCYTLTSLLSAEDMRQWGWRLPFIFGGILGVVSILIRKNTSETPHYILQSKTGRVSKPIVYLFKYHHRELLKGFSLVVLAANLVVFTLTYPAYVDSFTTMSYADIYLVMSFGMLTMAILVPIFGALSDRYGANTIFTTASVLYVLASPFLFNLANESSIVLNTLLVVILQTFIAALLGSFPTLLANLFPSKVRYTGIAFSYNTAFALSAFAPALINYIVLSSGQHVYTGLVFSCVGFLALSIWKSIGATSNFLETENLTLARSAQDRS